MSEAFLCDAVRTPIGRHAGCLSSIRADDLAALPIRTLIARNHSLDAAAVDDVILGCANQAGEDNRNLARMAGLLAGLPESVPGVTLNRLCGSGMDAVMTAARAIRAGEAEVIIAGGAESMSRAPFVVGKAQSAFDRRVQMYDTSIGWRFVNPEMDARYGTHSMPETAENVARDFDISRADQDAFACRSQEHAARAIANGRFACETVDVAVPRKKAEDMRVSKDEHPRPTDLESLARLRPIAASDGSVTAGNSSGINDGAAAMILASAAGARKYGLRPRARYVAGSVVGLAPRIMGMGPAPAVRSVLKLAGLPLPAMDVIEINEAFAAQALAVLRELGLAEDDARVNPNGGAIALGHPLGMSGARLVMTAVEEMKQTGGRHAVCAMCIGVGQGIASVFESVAE